ERLLDQVALAFGIFFLCKISPVRIVSVRAGNDQAARTALRASARVVKRIRATGDIAAEQQLGAKERRGGGEKQVTRTLIELLIRLKRHIDLRAAVVQTHGPGVIDERLVEMLLADKLQHCEFEIRVADDSIAFDSPAIDRHRGDLA